MSTPHERNSTGLLQPPPCDKHVKAELNFRETELRLGLPGSDSPERKVAAGVSLFGKDLKDENGGSGFLQTPLMGLFSGGKRCFNDAINGSGKWVSSVSDGSEVETETNEVRCTAREVVTTKGCLKTVEEKKKKNDNGSSNSTGPASKAQVVGWPPVRSFRKNALASTSSKDCDIASKTVTNGLYVKVSMEGAPYLRKINLKTYSSYAELSAALEKMFSCFTIGQYGQGLAGKEGLSESRLMDLLHGSEYVLTYEDKDGDWMLVGDVPWQMFAGSCKRLRIMKGSDAIGLAPRAMQKTKSQN